MALVVILIGLVVLSAIFGVGLWIYTKRLNKNLSDKSLNPDLQSATDMLPFVDIIDVKKGEFGVTDMGNNEYRAYLRVGSINYQLQSAREQDTTEMGYRRLLNVIDYPWVTHIQTHNVNSKQWDKALDKDVTKTLNDFRGTVAYNAIRKYYSITKQFTEKTRAEAISNGITQKEIRKYIIIPYNGNEDVLPNATPEEAKENALNKLSERVDQMTAQLSELGLTSEYLSRKQIIQLYTSEYNRDSNLFANEIAEGTFTSVYADDSLKYYLNNLSDQEKLYVLLNEAKNRLQTDIIRLNNADKKTKEMSKDISDYLEKEMEKAMSI